MKRSEKFIRLLHLVSDVTDVKKSEILSSARPLDVCIARGLFFMLCNEEGGMRPITIKRLCEDNGWSSISHSTVLQNITRAKKMSQSDDEFKTFLDEVRRDI